MNAFCREDSKIISTVEIVFSKSNTMPIYLEAVFRKESIKNVVVFCIQLSSYILRQAVLQVDRQNVDAVEASVKITRLRKNLQWKIDTKLMPYGIRDLMKS